MSSIFYLLGKSCLKTELQFSDYYCLLAVHLLLDLWLEEGMSLQSFFRTLFSLHQCVVFSYQETEPYSLQIR